MTANRPRLLVLAPRFPYVAVGGGTLVLLNILKALPDWDLTLLSLCNSQEEMDYAPSDGLFREVHKVYLPKWRSLANVLLALPGRTPLQLAYYRSAEFRKKVDKLLPQHDAALAHLIRSGQYLQDPQTNRPSVLLMSDAISMAYKTMTQVEGTSALWRRIYRVELDRLFQYEQTAPLNFSQTWLHSERDRRFLHLDSPSVRIIPIGIDLEEFPFRPGASGGYVAFIGNMSFSLNQDACLHFIHNILPSIRSQRDIRLRVIGVCPPDFAKKLLEFPGVDVTGRVARIADATSEVFCGVCPVRGGSGTQTKILNYLALGLPCVTSRVGLEGLSATDGADILVYNDPAEAAQLILKLHDDANLRDSIAAAGRRYVERNHDWQAIHISIRREMDSIRAESHRAPEPHQAS
jgi:glycosyltransferase involved in cell wall biosynthesis